MSALHNRSAASRNTKLAMKMEDSLQAFAVVLPFIGELEVPFPRNSTARFRPTHVIAYVGDEPVGTVRVRWFQSSHAERLAVMQRFRGTHRPDAARALPQACRVARCNMLYAQACRRRQVLEKQGWRRLSGGKPVGRQADRAVVKA